MINDSLVIGADIGGTHITAAIVDLEKKVVLTETTAREKLDSRAPADEIFSIWSKAISDAIGGYQIDKISLAIPGPFDYTNGISLMQGQNKYENLYGLNVKEFLAMQLDFSPGNISTSNDAAAFLQGEMFSGAGSNYQKAIGVTLGTGLGTCIYENGVSSNANMWNMPFKSSIAEDYISTRWFISRYKEISGQDIKGVRDLSEAINSAPSAKAIFEEFGHNLGEFLVNFASITSPDVIILGGNISKSFPYFKEPLIHQLKTKFPQIDIKTAELGEDAALMGAASYWKDKGKSLQSN